MPNDNQAAGFNLQTAVRLFFDRPEIERALAATEARGLRETGKRLRFEARDLLVRRKGPAKPGDVPHVHSTDKKYSLRFILYFYEPTQHRLVVGPVGLTRDPAPGILEHGGSRTFDEVQVAGRWGPARWSRSDAAFETYPRRQRVARIEPRPFMARALEAALPQIPEDFRGQLGKGSP